MLNKVKELEKELNYIQTDWIKFFTKKVVENAPDYFFEVAASSTGKYHPAYALGEKGLLRHVKAAAKIANDVLRLESVRNIVNFDCVYNCDVVIAAIILHDICKSGYPDKSKYTLHNHPLLASDLIRDTLQEFVKDDYEQVDNLRWYISTVCSLVESHMGEWNTNKYCKDVLPKPRTISQTAVHVFDFLASRKYINVDFTD